MARLLAAALVLSTIAVPAWAKPRLRIVCTPVAIEGVGTVRICGVPFRRR